MGQTLVTMEPFIPYYQWPEYDLESDVLPHLRPQPVGVRPLGVQWGFWPLRLEEYIGDEEPILSEGPLRLVLWRRYARTDIPAGWRRALRQTASWIEGYAELERDYRQAWSKTARHDAKRWERESPGIYAIEEVSFDEFSRSYLSSQVGRKLQDSRLQVLGRKLKGPHSRSVRLIAARHLPTGELVAGMGLIESASLRRSFYYCGFFRGSGAKDGAMTGLIDYWLKDCVSRGFVHAHMGQFWMPGESEDRKGFSRFKEKFGMKYATCQAPLWRLAGRKFF